MNFAQGKLQHEFRSFVKEYRKDIAEIKGTLQRSSAGTGPVVPPTDFWTPLPCTTEDELSEFNRILSDSEQLKEAVSINFSCSKVGFKCKFGT